MKVAVQAVFRVCNRTALVDVSDADLKTLKDWKGCPYKGKTPKDFVTYLPSLLNYIRDQSEEDLTAPKIARELFYDLAHPDTRTIKEAWAETRNPVPTQIVAFDDQGREIDGAEADNGEDYFGG